MSSSFCRCVSGYVEIGVSREMITQHTINIKLLRSTWSIKKAVS